MIQDFQFKQKYSVEDLVEIMRILRSENGCPWDREQTHESIRKNFIEETYEVIEAINKADSHLLCEELGDVLMRSCSTRKWKRKNKCLIFPMSPTAFAKN